MIDANGYRFNVGIILCNSAGKLFWAKRMGSKSWQFPQGGIKKNETLETSMYRELREETGLKLKNVSLIGRTRSWLHYDLPERFIRKNSLPLCIGQKQIWFLLRLTSNESRVCFDLSDHPEFDDWRWVDYWKPLQDVVYFKRKVYQKVMVELGAMLVSEQVPVCAQGYLSGKNYFNIPAS